MNIDEYLIRDINSEIKSCSRDGVTFNPCRFYGGTFTEDEVEELLPKLRNPASDAVYPVPANESEYTDKEGFCFHFLRNAIWTKQEHVDEALAEVADGYEHIIHEAANDGGVST
jgi:hypothetical protein